MTLFVKLLQTHSFLEAKILSTISQTLLWSPLLYFLYILSGEQAHLAYSGLWDFELISVLRMIFPRVET